MNLNHDLFNLILDSEVGFPPKKYLLKCLFSTNNLAFWKTKIIHPI